MSEVTARPGMVGRVLSIEDLTQMIPSYPDGRRPRSRTVARRMSPVLELVERGPNGSRGKGATYRILPSRAEVTDGEPIAKDDEWLLAAVERMTGG